MRAPSEDQPRRLAKLHPTAGLSRSKDRFDYLHISDRFFKRHRYLGVIENRLGELVTLQSVLVADRKFFCHAIHAKQVALSIKMRVGRSFGALNGISISIRHFVPKN